MLSLCPPIQLKYVSYFSISYKKYKYLSYKIFDDYKVNKVYY